MNIVNQLTLRQLKLNKRRTLVTILGAIISVAMITGVLVSASSGIDLLKRMSISQNGDWHMRFGDMKAENIQVLEQADNIGDVLLDVSVGYSQLEQINNMNKPYLFVRGFNEASFEFMPVTLLEGRFPEKDDEVVIPEHLAKGAGLNYQIGDQITLKMGERYENIADSETPEGEEPVSMTQGYGLVRDEEGQVNERFVAKETKTYTVVGKIEKSPSEYSWSPGYELITFTNSEYLLSDQLVDASVRFKNLTSAIYKDSRALGTQVGVEVVQPNSSLLACYGINSDDGLMFALGGMVAIIMSIIMVGSVSLIYNAFAISVAERSQYLGMLASVGATKKQKRNSVFFEGAIIGGISIPLGIIAGFIGMGITFKFINGLFKEALMIEENLVLAGSIWTILGIIVIAILTIFISTYVPARRASKITPIEAIKQTADIKMNRKKIKTSVLTRKIFGIEGEIALKNLKRNGRRYRATLLSLIVSIVLFLSTAAFTTYMGKSMEMMMAGTNYDLRVYMPYAEDSTRKETLKALKGIEGVERASLIESTYFDTLLKEELLPDFIKEAYGEIEEGTGYEYSVNLMSLEKDVFEAYVKQIGADLESLTNPNQPAAILINRMQFKDPKTKLMRDEDFLKVDVGSKLGLVNKMWLEDGVYESEEIGDITIGALAKDVPMGISIPDSPNYVVIQLIVSEEVYGSMVEQAEKMMDVYSYKQLYLTSNDPFALQAAIENLNDSSGVKNYDVFNVYEMQKSYEQMQTIMKVFMYGFISLITLVSVANIFNTISTSIALRKREFAMLRSVGMTPKGFNKMINFESIFYGLKALLYGLPISLLIMVGMYQNLSRSFGFAFFIPVQSVMVVIVSVFVIVGIAMFYSGAKVKGENIIEGLKDTNL